METDIPTVTHPTIGEAVVRIAKPIAISLVLAASVSTLAAEAPLEEVIITARQIEEPIFLTPYSVDRVDAKRIRRANFRTTPDIFREIPGTLVQKTAQGQGSPYIRGFTGYRNLFMIDGIRLNNAVFREGPNQYWATVDPGSIDRMEVVRGPKSVLYGSDAIGGTVNVLTRSPTAYQNNELLGGGLRARYGHAENSAIIGGHLDAAFGQRGGLLVGGTVKRFGDIQSGDGELPNTGYDEWALDAKFAYELNDNLTLSAAHSQVHQDDVPRTHKTIYSRPFADTTIGSEFKRDLDQDRQLTYVKLEAFSWLGWENWHVTLFRHQQEEQRERERSGDRHDSQGVKVDTFGVNLLTSRPTQRAGIFTAGLDWARDYVDSWSSNNDIQGPVADDSTYDWAGVFLQNRYNFTDNLDLTTGLRLAHFGADANSISDPVDGSAFSYDQTWTEPVGSVRLGWSPVPERWRLYSGVSQGLRAPNLSDLTRFDSARSNEFEIPSVDLKPERYVQYELGARWRTSTAEVEGAVYYTDIKGQIQRVATGEQNEDGEFEVTKENNGDGEIYGVELKANWMFVEKWNAFGHFAWLDGEISTEEEVGSPLVDDYHSRMMPTNYRLGVHYEQGGQFGWWAETEVIVVEEADRLSIRDEGDTQRIPPGGTPGYTLWHLRGGARLTEALALNLALENLLNENYRVHGSGQNEPGRNAVVSLDYFF